jgi:epoxyqueuosine reductase QueG
MNIRHEEITTYARRLGIDDVGFASADSAAHNILPGASSVVVLFRRYWPAAAPPPDTIAMSGYYIASHAAYLAAKQLTAWLVSRDTQAVHTTSLPAKPAALKTCGFIGDNGFFFHPQYGSLLCIQTIVTDAVSAQTRKDGPTECLHCGACADACPSHAVGHHELCLRYHIDGIVPEPLRGDVYQLIGCEKCQTACPLNSHDTSPPRAYAIGDLLDGKHIKELKALAGPNFVRQRRVMSQAVLYAAAARLYHHLPCLHKLAATTEEPLRTHARWACALLEKGVPQ